MTDFIDDWLNQIGQSPSPQPSSGDRTVIPEALAEVEEVPLDALPPAVEEPPAVTQSPQDMTADDFGSLLTDLGFDEEQEEEETTESEGGSGEVEVTTSEAAETVSPSSHLHSWAEFARAIQDDGHRQQSDLDAQEDAGWNALEQAGVVTPVNEHNVASTAAASSQANIDRRRQQQAQSVRVTVGDQSADVPVVTAPSERPQLYPNSPTLLIDESTSRFSGTEWYNAVRDVRVIIAGLGGIGSNLAFNVARLHPRAMYLYDADIVEQVNMSGQLFSYNDQQKYKVDAVSDTLRNFCSVSPIYAYRARYHEDSLVGPVMMCGFDNMAARRLFFEKWQSYVLTLPDAENRKKCLFLDGRLSIDTLQIFCISGDDGYSMDRYSRDYLFDDSEADETVCSMKQTTYLACMIGSLMTNLFVNHTAGLLDPIIPYDLPFFTEYDAQSMLFKTCN